MIFSEEDVLKYACSPQEVDCAKKAFLENRPLAIPRWSINDHFDDLIVKMHKNPHVGIRSMTTQQNEGRSAVRVEFVCTDKAISQLRMYVRWMSGTLRSQGVFYNVEWSYATQREVTNATPFILFAFEYNGDHCEVPITTALGYEEIFEPSVKMPEIMPTEAADAVAELFNPGFMDGKMEREIYRVILSTLKKKEYLAQYGMPPTDASVYTRDYFNLWTKQE